MSERKSTGRFVAFFVALATVWISACFSRNATAQADMFSSADPSKYMLFGCKQLAEARPLIVYRMQKLEGLMAKAATGPGGGFASSMAYNSEYSMLRGDLKNLEARAADRNCPPLPQGAAAPANELPVAPARPARRKPAQ